MNPPESTSDAYMQWLREQDRREATWRENQRLGNALPSDPIGMKRPLIQFVRAGRTDEQLEADAKEHLEKQQSKNSHPLEDPDFQFWYGALFGFAVAVCVHYAVWLLKG